MPCVKSCINIFSCIYCNFHSEESLLALIHWFRQSASQHGIYQFFILNHWRVVKCWEFKIISLRLARTTEVVATNSCLWSISFIYISSVHLTRCTTSTGDDQLARDVTVSSTYHCLPLSIMMTVLTSPAPVNTHNVAVNRAGLGLLLAGTKLVLLTYFLLVQTSKKHCDHSVCSPGKILLLILNELLGQSSLYFK